METFALYFNIIVQFAGILYIAFAFVLCLYKTPKREIYKTYRRSQRFLALNYLVMGTNCLAWCFVRPDVWWLKLDPIVEIMDTSLFLLSAIFLTFFFGNLLGTIKASTHHHDSFLSFMAAQYASLHKLVVDGPFIGWPSCKKSFSDGLLHLYLLFHVPPAEGV